MEPIRHDEQGARVLKAAYDAGYGDAVLLLRPRSADCMSAEPIERVQGRYLGYFAMAHPTEEALAYISGFGDAAADNLPCRSQAIEDRLIAA